MILLPQNHMPSALLSFPDACASHAPRLARREATVNTLHKPLLQRGHTLFFIDRVCCGMLNF